MNILLYFTQIGDLVLLQTVFIKQINKRKKAEKRFSFGFLIKTETSRNQLFRHKCLTNVICDKLHCQVDNVFNCTLFKPYLFFN